MINDSLRNILLAVQECRNKRQIIGAILSGHDPNTVALKNGIRVNGPEDTLSIINEVFFRKSYNPNRMPIGQDDVVVDIGANIGVFTIFAAHRTRNRVYAFEPFPSNLDFLNQNIRANDLHNVISHEAAVSNSTGQAKLFLGETNEGHLLFDHNITGKLENYIMVATTTLQSIIDDNDLERIDFLKMDCEGSEGSILMSLPKSYFKKIAKIAMEFHDNVSPLRHEEIEALLKSMGFVAWTRWDGKSPFGYLYGLQPRWG